MLPGLLWVHELHSSLNRALDGQIVKLEFNSTADPLKKVVRMTFRPELSSNNYQPLQIISHAFAAANKCTLERIRRENPHLLFEISIRRRLGPPMNHNPMLAKKGVGTEIR